ncbi:FG-GAP-like repeat-containing protein, partial [Marichromatium sp. AB31]|uniref:FG-GAP-like repeat-containing protein n=1 Tax=Marichromatium sp. AB31 TaxID=2483362 RepID=UPI000F3EC5C1
MSTPNFPSSQTNPLGLSNVGGYATPTIADIDADGDLDVFVGNNLGELLLFTNTGDASNPAFSSAITNPFSLSNVGNGATPSLVDLDGDGDLDLVVGNWSGDLLFFENTGTASEADFASPATNPYNLTIAGSNATPALADIDDDGHLDAFVGNEHGELLYFHNTGSATQPDFATPSASPFGLSPVDRSTKPTLADIDGDGRLDLLVGGYSGDIWLFENTGSTSEPAFASAASNPYGLTDVGLYSSPAFADLDADGDLDALVGNSDGDLLLFRNEPLPGVTLSQSSVEVTEGGATATYTLVLDTQPSADVTVTLDTTNDQVGVDQTTLTFTPEDWDTPQQVTVTAVDDSVGEGPHRGVISHTVTSTDAGYDGAAIDNVQVAVTDDDLPTEEPTFQPPQVNPLGLDDVGASASPTFADIDADGDLDVFVGTTTTMTVNNGGGDGNGVNGILFFENTGDASNPAFSSAITNPFGLSDVGNGASPSLVDLDGDGDLDLVVGNLGGDLLFFENTGTASSAAFGNAQTTAFGLEQNSQAYDFAFADLDGDGLVDAFVGNDSGELFYFHNTGSATQPDFAAPSASPFGLSPVDRSTTPTLADIDGDGRLDLLVGGYSGDIWLFENTGSTSEPAFASAVSNPYGLTNVGVYSSPALADLDADGDLDALVGNSDGDLLLFRNGTPPGVTLSQSSVEVTEGGATATYTLVLDTQPSADVTVTLDTTNDQVGVDQTTLTFTPEDWDTPQQVTVTAVDDSVGEGPHRGVISHTVTSTDSGYDGAAIDNVQIAVTDDDLPTEEPTFQPPQVNPLGLDDVGASASPTFADIDADGDLDVFVGNDSGDLLFFENTGGASNPDFSSASTNPFGLSNVDNYTAPSLADLDGDGDLDLVVGNWRGDLLFFENTGTASEAAFAPPTTNPFNLPSTGMLLATPVLTDLNDDGRIDAFVSYYNGKFMYFQNTGSPTQPDFVTFDSPSLPFMDLWVYPALADIDGDDLFELLVGNSDGDIFLFENIGSVTAPSFDFTVMNPYGLSDMGLQISPALADLDADGDLDALVGNSDGDLLLLLNGETSGGGGSGSTPDRDDEGDGDLFVGEDGAILDNGRIDTGLNPTESFTDTTLDGAPVTTGTTTDSRTGEDVAVVVSDPSAPGERTDVDPTTPEVDIPIGGLVVSKPESLGLIATSRVSTERSALETLTGGDDAAADPEEAAGRAALIDSLEARAGGVGVEVVQVTPVWPSEGGAGDAPLRLTIDLGDDSGSDARPTLVVVDTSALYDAAGAPLGPVEIVVAGAGTLVVRGPGSFRGDDGDAGSDVDIVQGDGSAQVLFFGPDDDIIRGGGGDDTLGSAGGRDRLFGDGGDDRLDGGLGADILVGGSGNDQL